MNSFNDLLRGLSEPSDAEYNPMYGNAGHGVSGYRGVVGSPVETELMQLRIEFTKLQIQLECLHKAMAVVCGQSGHEYCERQPGTGYYEVRSPEPTFNRTPGVPGIGHASVTTSGEGSHGLGLGEVSGPPGVDTLHVDSDPGDPPDY